TYFVHFVPNWSDVLQATPHVHSDKDLRIRGQVSGQRHIGNVLRVLTHFYANQASEIYEHKLRAETLCARQPEIRSSGS
uniref:Uncharacterized protein n=1 Tax=Romanomermis culicivorax TaxID=13658 RepID=A0A915K2B5_ROMCU